MKFRVWMSVLFISIFTILNPLRISAENTHCPIPTTDPMEEPTLMRLTYYTASEGAVCSTGCKPFYGCAAGAKKYEHCVAMIWSADPETGEPDEFLGYWDIRDYGKGFDMGDGTYSIPEGYSLDLYFETGNAGQEFMSKWGNEDCLFRVYIQSGKG